jgi:hypothetical protein
LVKAQYCYIIWQYNRIQIMNYLIEKWWPLLNQLIESVIVANVYIMIITVKPSCGCVLVNADLRCYSGTEQITSLGAHLIRQLFLKYVKGIVKCGLIEGLL